MMKRHAYLILAHNNFGQLRKLVSLLDDPRNDIFIHIDGRAHFNGRKWQNVCRHSALVFTKRRFRVHWGGYSIIRSEMELLKTATSFGEYDYYHLLSGADLPLKSQDTIHEFFDKNGGQEFLNLWDMTEEAQLRFRYYTLFPEGARNFITAYFNKIVKNHLRKRGRTINDGIEFKYGSQWFSITDSLARYAVTQEDWIDKVFSHTCICDEVFFATLVWNSGFRDKISPKNTNLRRIDWPHKAARHPITFRTGDFESLMNCDAFWARKFSENVDNEIIEKIYNRLK